MTDAITRQVRRAIEAANSARPLPHFDHILTHRGEPSHWPERILSPHYTERGQKISQLDRRGHPHTGQLGRRAAIGPSGRPTHTTTKCRELKKGLHELADKGQIDRFLKRGPQNNSASLESSAQKCITGAYHGARTPRNSPHNGVWRKGSFIIHLPP
ncbi:hypothetical protein Cgig2_025097 [Carnegiea gigantea]|uniref:Uncharacterized protein n=1 Tax=Carnegiea gigantea TaxID=171969 RepID=A0A9Q1KJR6_9CARY|nr:hypothetical protein Cgig2_025097 [Carnegiea gigantea]